MGKMQGPRPPRLPARERRGGVGFIRLLCAVWLAAAGSAQAQKIAGDTLPAVTPVQPVPPAGTLRVIGRYPLDALRQPAMARLPDGQVFVYGISPDGGWRDANGQPVWTLRHRARTVSFPYPPEPLLWQPSRHAWSRLKPPPECTGSAFLHTATALPGGKVLIAGGLCDQSKDGTDGTPQAPYAHLSLWNSASGAWEPAPSLQQPRIYHTATLLDDGSVLLVGGEADPALSPDREPVLASVERYRDGRLEPLPSLLTARARHTATAMRDGSVLVVGGIDEHGTAIAAAEQWDAAQHAWRALPPLAHARYAHTATLLDDGRVLIAGGYDAEGHPQDSVELWDPARAAWSAGMPLPRPMQSHSATKLAHGDVLIVGGLSAMTPDMIDWAFVWTPATETWRPAGQLRPDTSEAVAQQPLLAPLPDGTALVFGYRQILQWRPSASDGATEMTALRSKPALAALADGGLMVIARTGDQPQWTAQIWHPATDRWQRAGTLAYRDGRDTAAIQLRSGRVMHLGFGAHNDLSCELGGTDDSPWTGCGQLALQKISDTPVGLGLLPDGRVALVANAEEAFVFDEAGGSWAPTPLEWNEQDLTYGAPIRTGHPLARLRDPTRDAWLDVSAIAARYWENVYPRRQATVSFSDGRQTTLSSRPNPPTLLWDPGKREWAYVLLYGTMGIDAQRLPDGCALSWTPLTLFDPRSGNVVKLADPGIGVRSFEGTMLALADGTVVIAGVPDGGIGGGFFYRKASCAGFASDADDALAMPGIYVSDLPKTPSPAAPAAAASAQAPNAFVAMAKDNPWPWLAALGTLLLYLLLRFAVLPLVRYVSRRTLAQRTRDTLTRRLPSPFAWITRIVIYGALALFCVATVRPFLHFRQQQAERACDERASQCVDPDSGLMRSLPALEAGPGHPKPTIPCRYVGVWSSRNGGLMFRVTLKDDGSFVEAPNAAGYGNPAGYTGYWMVQGDYLVWRDNARPSLGPDVNRILEPSDGAFALVEGNGSHTRFERIQPVPSNRCTP